RRIQFRVAQYHDAVIVAYQDLAGSDLDVSQANGLLGDRKLRGSRGTRNSAEGVDGQRQLGQGRRVATRAVDDNASHTAPYSFGCEELTKHGLLGCACVDNQNVARA